ncbi:MAG TPA: hypothetical protein VMU14_19480 [Acidimicrobiales bacterium]|nr:hypothetical protein [Acidimicrobiales bacterium]
MTWLLAFGKFWYDFVVGDDWRVAAGVVLGVGATALVAQTALAAWWVLPFTVALTLAWSLRHAVGPLRGVRPDHPSRSD